MTARKFLGKVANIRCPHDGSLLEDWCPECLEDILDSFAREKVERFRERAARLAQCHDDGDHDPTEDFGSGYSKACNDIEEAIRNLPIEEADVPREHDIYAPGEREVWEREADLANRRFGVLEEKVASLESQLAAEREARLRAEAELTLLRPAEYFYGLPNFKHDTKFVTNAAYLVQTESEKKIKELEVRLLRAEVGAAVMRKALGFANAAVWDAHYGKGIDVAYVRKVEKDARTALKDDTGSRLAALVREIEAGPCQFGGCSEKLPLCIRCKMRGRNASPMK